MQFTQDWFTHNIPAWTQLQRELKGRDDLSVLEIGVFERRLADMNDHS